jgi:YfiH family protein
VIRFDLPGAGHALFTTRVDGNLSSVGGVDAGHGLQARERLRRRVGVERLLRSYQVHGRTVRRVRGGAHESELGGEEIEAGADIKLDPSEGAETTPEHPPDSAAQPNIEADGQATAASGLGVLVLTADCLPVALGSSGAVAIVHAGWRGLAAGVLEEGVRALRELGGEGDLVAVIGPGAGPCCYEVGEEVHAAFGGAHRIQSSPPGTPPGRNIDLKAIARDRLLAAGASEVRDVGACTICEERFFSYRREGAHAGRQGGVAWLS